MKLSDEEQARFDELVTRIDDLKADCKIAHRAWQQVCAELDAAEREVRPLFLKLMGAHA